MSKTTDNSTKAQWQNLADEAIADSGYWKHEARQAQAQRDAAVVAMTIMLKQCRDSNEPTAISMRLQLSAAIAAAERSAS